MIYKKRVLSEIKVFPNILAMSLAVCSVYGCSSSPPVKTQAYAKFANHRIYEYDFPTVWRAIESSLRTYKIVDRNPREIDPMETKKQRQGSLETDWIYGQSRNKFQDYWVNGAHRKKYLQTRFRYNLVAETVMGGTDVKITMDEEIERLTTDGVSEGFEAVDEADSSRMNELLDKINLSILSVGP